ncbi:hypothetical protein ANT2_0790 [plant metagenome]|uniref:Toxin VasX N-terminal region domain-containing protein n=1 Tax=plant metagenome TaxID=1297885 RepID=A0A484R823_9ZZZZ
MSNNPCRTCQATGLPVLPCRYTVIPKDFIVPLAEPLGVYSGERVKDVAISDRYRYAVRTLRAGFLYLFYESGPQGSNYWEAYAVTEAGELWKAADAQSVQGAATKACSSQGGHNALRMQYLVIEKPEQCGKVWLAYSEHKWSDKTLQRYEGGPERAKRMQPIEPAAWIAAAQAANHQAILATGSNLKTSLEYFSELDMLNGEFKDLPYTGPDAPPAISREDGTHVEAQLRLESTRHPWHLRNTGQGAQKDKVLDALMQQMEDKCGDPSMGVAYWPMGIALWDAIGLAEELNGYYNDALGALARYGEERTLQITAAANIRAAKTALESGAANRADRANQHAREGIRVGERFQDVGARRAVIDSYFQTDAGKQAMSALEVRRATGAVDQTTYDQERAQIFQQHLPPDKHADAGRAFDTFHAHLDSERARLEGTMGDYRKDQINRAWPKYEDRINWGKLTAFERQYEVFQRTALQLADERAGDLIKWLESPLLLDTLEDYHPAVVEDGEEFAEVVADLTEGLGGSKVGHDYLTQLIQNRTNATGREALFWRAIAANQDTLRQELEAALTEAEARKNEILNAGPSSAELLAAALLKNFKTFTDFYKKSVGVVHEQNEGKLTYLTRKLKNANIDKLMMNCGDTVFRWLQINRVADFFGEKFIQHIFLLRAGVLPADALSLVRMQARYEGVNREQAIARIRTARTFLEANEAIARQPGNVALAEMWGKIRPADGRAGATGMRIGLVVGLIEGVNLRKTLVAAQKSPKEYLQIAASLATLSAVVIDIAIVPYQLMGKRAYGFQKWKLRGAALGFVASTIQLGLDTEQMVKNFSERRIAVGVLYIAKIGLGLGATVASVISALATSGPLLKRVGQRAGVQILVVVGSTVPKWVAVQGVARVLGLLVGWEVALVAIGIQIAIWVFTPDVLEEWCETSAFGKQRFGTPQSDAKKQEEGFVKALADVS